MRTRVDDLIDETVTVADVLKHVYCGAAADKICEWIEHVEADLFVIGTQCRSGAAGLFIGNTAESIQSGVTCSALTVKPARFGSSMELDRERAVVRENADPSHSIFLKRTTR